MIVIAVSLVILLISSLVMVGKENDIVKSCKYYEKYQVTNSEYLECKYVRVNK